MMQMSKEHVLVEEEQMAAARPNQHEEEKHTQRSAEEQKKRRKQGKTQENRAQWVDSNQASRLATKPSRRPCHPICHVLPILIGSGVQCQYCRCHAPPLGSLGPHVRCCYTSWL